MESLKDGEIDDFMSFGRSVLCQFCSFGSKALLKFKDRWELVYCEEEMGGTYTVMLLNIFIMQPCRIPSGVE